MKKAISFILVLILIFSAAPFAFAAPSNSAKAVVLMHADTGQVLFGQNADSPMLIASTTKIMTALVVLNNCDPDERVEILPEYAGIEGSSMYLVAGEYYSVRDLLYGMMLVSGNDAATALAGYCGGSIEGFAAMMNEEASRLGLKNTSFENPHGLDGEKQYSSAYDLAVITSEALKNELFAEIVSTKTYNVGDKSYMNHNKLLWSYEGCIGIKTGYTIAAGRTLVSGAERDGMKLVCVTLSDPDDWDDHKDLYDWAFSAFEYRSVLPMGEICKVPVISGEAAGVGVASASEERLFLEKGAEIDYSIEVPWFVYAGINKGEAAGSIKISVNGELAGEYPLVYADSVPLAEGIRLTPWERFLKSWFLSGKYGFVLGGRI